MPDNTKILTWLDKRMEKEEENAKDWSMSKERKLTATISSYITVFGGCWAFCIINKRPEAEVMTLSMLLLMLGYFAYRAAQKDILERNEGYRILHLGRCLRAVICPIYPALSMYVKNSVLHREDSTLKSRCASGASRHTGVEMVLSVYEVMLALLWAITILTVKHHLSGMGTWLSHCAFEPTFLKTLEHTHAISSAVISLSALDLLLVIIVYTVCRIMLVIRRKIRFTWADCQGKKLIRQKVQAFRKTIENGELLTFFD